MHGMHTVLHMMNMREDYLIHNTHRNFRAWLFPFSLSLDNLNAISCILQLRNITARGQGSTIFKRRVYIHLEMAMYQLVLSGGCMYIGNC